MEDDEEVVKDTNPIVEEAVEEVEEIDPLAEAIQRAEDAEKEITYRISHLRKMLFLILLFSQMF